ncbi:hypothetical protein I4U23_017062 [Adineta vaga]|nr:hypothetical protein I4U23_017062 [Adineta vaga]
MVECRLRAWICNHTTISSVSEFENEQPLVLIANLKPFSKRSDEGYEPNPVRLRDMRKSLKINSTRYELRATIHHKDAHFTATLIDPLNALYIYDDQKGVREQLLGHMSLHDLIDKELSSTTPNLQSVTSNVSTITAIASVHGSIQSGLTNINVVMILNDANLSNNDVIIDIVKGYELRRIGVYSPNMAHEIVHTFVPIDKLCGASLSTDVCLFISSAVKTSVVQLATIKRSNQIMYTSSSYDREHVSKLINKDMNEVLVQHHPNEILKSAQSTIHFIDKRFYYEKNEEKQLVTASATNIADISSSIPHLYPTTLEILQNQISNNKISFDYLSQTDLKFFLAAIFSKFDRISTSENSEEASFIFLQSVIAQSIFVLRQCSLSVQSSLDSRLCVAISTLFLRVPPDTITNFLIYRLIPLPIVGKSSVLEALSGVQLPRAQNICTRCPLELRMKSIPIHEKEYAIIRCDGVNEILINDFSDIMKLITDCTVRLAGDKLNVSTKPIYLTVYKHSIQADLTLIDLPGITRNPLDGQSKTIYQDIVTLIEHYIEPKTAIVLHVIPSSVDFTTSESIQLAKKNDPTCERQLIAVSKIDKFDKGIGEKLQGIGPGSMVLKLGCIAVLNRTQEEIDENIPFDEMRRREQSFFRSNQAFVNVPERYLGSYQLVKRLTLIQQERIRSTLPSIIDQLKNEIKSKKTQLKQMPPSVSSEIDCWSLYTSLLKKYSEIINSRVHGVYDNEMQFNFNESNLRTATTLVNQDVNDRFDERIAFQLYNRQKDCRNAINTCFTDFFSTQYQTHVLKLLEENAGVALPNFPSFSIVERLYHLEQNKLIKPCADLVESYVEYLKTILIKILHQIFIEETSYKYNLIHKLTDIIMCTLDESYEHCKIDLVRMLEIEQRIFTLDTYYMDCVDKIKKKCQDHLNSLQLNGNKQIGSSVHAINDFTVNLAYISNQYPTTLDVQTAITAYCRVVGRRVIDQISQLCYYWFITRCALILDSKLTSVYTSAILFEWMREPFDQQQKRESLKTSIDAMERALLMGQNI